MITQEQEREELIATVCRISAWCFDSILCITVNWIHTNTVDIKRITRAVLCCDKLITPTLLVIKPKTIHQNISPPHKANTEYTSPTDAHLHIHTVCLCLNNYVYINIWWTTKMFAPCHILSLSHGIMLTVFTKPHLWFIYCKNSSHSCFAPQSFVRVACGR